jgi:hypothetical protein
MILNAHSFVAAALHGSYQHASIYKKEQLGLVAARANALYGS